MKYKMGQKIIVIILLFNMVLSLPFYLPIYGQVYAFGFNISEFVGEMSRDLLNSFLTTTDTIITGEDQGTAVYSVYEENNKNDNYDFNDEDTTPQSSYDNIKVEGAVYESKDMFLWPTPGYKNITSPFGPRTYTYNGKRVSSNHHGIDIGAPSGANIVASADGKVITASYNADGYGNYIVIDHR